ncbi:MAG: rhomboid family intramembrane serine protease [Dactylosporangium sp.]|nr:rhomboid family intramembrane serine protease [Dactylosporangium sp.]NNJ60866.1 rhomboid family intramembrane serine protease [Dactylosporangium sp.]
MTEPPTAIPVCYRHPSRETYVRCARCDRPICPDCMHDASVGHQCPDCVAAGRRTQRPTRTRFGGSDAGMQGYVTKTLIILNSAVALAALISASDPNAVAGQGMAGLLGGSTPLHYAGAIVAEPTSWTSQGTIVASAAGVANGEYYRLFTSMFLHYGIMHLLMNMWALWVLGRPLEATLGRARFLALYLLSGLGGSVAVYLFSNPHAPTAGASGAIFGLFAALFVVLRRLRRSASGILPVLLLNLVITFTVPGISIAGHLGGMAVGALVAVGLAYASGPRRTPLQIGVCTLIGVALVLATVARTAMITGVVA